MANKRNQNTNKSRTVYTKQKIKNLKTYEEIEIFPDNNYHIGFFKPEKLTNLLENNEFTPKQKSIFLREITTSQIKTLSNDDLKKMLKLTPRGIQGFTQKQIQALNQSQIEYILNNDRSQAAKQYLIDNLTSEQKQGIQQHLTPAVVPPVEQKPEAKVVEQKPEAKVVEQKPEEKVEVQSQGRLWMKFMPVILASITAVVCRCISYNSPDITR